MCILYAYVLLQLFIRFVRSFVYSKIIYYYYYLNFRYLRDNLPFVHPNHIAIWGHAYGGFVAASALAASDTVFKCAVAISPITSWIYYSKS